MTGIMPFNTKYAVLPAGLGDFRGMLDDFFSDSYGLMRSAGRDTFKIDVEETPETYVIQAELPGVKRDEIDMEFDDGILTVSVKKEENAEEEKKNYLHRERRVTSMSRKIHLPEVRTDGIKARLEDGVLRVALEKERKTNKKIPIELE